MGYVQNCTFLYCHLQVLKDEDISFSISPDFPYDIWLFIRKPLNHMKRPLKDNRFVIFNGLLFKLFRRLVSCFSW